MPEEDGGGREGRYRADAEHECLRHVACAASCFCVDLEAALRPGVLYGPRFVEF